MFWLGFSGLPRRIHDYPSVFSGWHSMATAGHLVTMLGVMFFFITIFDSFVEKKVPLFYCYGIPRFYKRASYYLHKVRHNQNSKNQNQMFPSVNVRSRIISHFNEFERL